jgi:hypothetical protein
MGVAGGANAASLSPNAPNPAPGSITVTFNALVESFFFFGRDDQANRASEATGQKYQNVAIGTYARLYPSFDGVLANGLKYGGAIEIRQNAQTGNNPTNAGGSPTFYAQREYVYVGADRVGRFYFGGQVPPTELFQVGNPVNFNDGGWDGDLPGFFVNGGIPYFIDDANDRSAKLMYVSPQFFGFDFSVSYAGNDVGNSMNAATRLSQDTTLSEAGLRKNVVDAAIRYQTTFGPVGFKVNIGGTTATPINPCPTDAACPVPPGSGAGRRDYTLYAGGISLTWAGFEVDGHVDTGVFGPGLTTVTTGSTGTTAWIAGLSYTVGPLIVGASYYGFESGYLKGNSTPTQSVGGLSGYGVAAGGTYTLAPGASIFLDYLYGHQRANGWDFAADGLAGAPGPAHNSANSNGMGIGMAFKW